MRKGSHSVEAGSVLTFYCSQRWREMRDRDGMSVFKEVRKNKSTEKDGSTPASREEVDVYHFTKVTNVALLLFNTFFFVAKTLLRVESLKFVFKECHFEETVGLLFFYFILHLLFFFLLFYIYTFLFPAHA